jgi:hypothetical protein
MKIALTLTLLAVAAFGARTLFCGECCCPMSRTKNAAPSGDYVEARSASVYAGACHYNGEYVTAGREAVLAWHFDAGKWNGQSLAGVDLVALVAANDNLAEKGAARRSVVYADAGVSESQREAAVAWLKANHACALGEVVAVETADVQVVRTGERYSVHAGDAVELSGSTMPDRACCAMPFNVWYEPFESVAGRVVGCSERFVAHAQPLGLRFSREGANDAFLGHFGQVAKQEVAAL